MVATITIKLKAFLKPPLELSEWHVRSILERQTAYHQQKVVCDNFLLNYMIAIIDYGLGNLGSVKNALDALQVESVITSKRKQIDQADGIIFPGVGAAGEGMKNLKLSGLDHVIKEEIKKNKPFLGICLGMQIGRAHV